MPSSAASSGQTERCSKILTNFTVTVARKSLEDGRQEVGGKRERPAIKDKFILPTDHIYIKKNSDSTARLTACAMAVRFQVIERRGIERDDYFGTTRQALMTSGVQMSSQIGRPTRRPRTSTGPGISPGIKFRLSSKTP